ncbi:hypothetical protein [Pseudodesulfovibrio tunisiensis]|uniref:hypothetical protein n=1 Tax=Pseudodesulfovibrio tunisiensis TaxID=463192 RepID=UPI001FB4671E|nr:hypothetical protein [Pseudodesulfovibrio tunisiensis]
MVRGPGDVTEGRVVHFDVADLSPNGCCTARPGTAVNGLHYFLCLAVEGDVSYWLPTFSKDGGKLVVINGDEKIGIQDWLTNDRDPQGRNNSYAFSNQIWALKVDTVLGVSGVDAAPLENPNCVTPDCLDRVRGDCSKFLAKARRLAPG